MSLYHQLETVEIPSISAFRISGTESQNDLVMAKAQFAAPASQHLMPQQQTQNTDPFEDPFVTTKERQATVQAAIPVASVPERIYGAASGVDRKRLVLDR